MIEFYVRWITVKRTIKLEDVPTRWYEDVKAELIEVGYITK